MATHWYTGGIEYPAEVPDYREPHPDDPCVGFCPMPDECDCEREEAEIEGRAWERWYYGGQHEDEQR